ncbi:MAG: lysophospholipid acyltransferase family protein [Deltaproteobacteria bacterium]|nr:lysophospholipid acyltransferase family protein [Deltaproteobacteria bacterium]
MTLLLKIKGFFLRLLPDKLFYFISCLLGYFWFYVLRIRRKTAVKNVIMALNVGKEEAEKIVLGSMINLVSAFMEFISQREVRIEFSGYKEIKEILAKGAIVVTAHTANWDVLEQAASKEKINLGVLSRKSRFMMLQAFAEDVRRRRGETVFYEDTGFSVLMKFLKSKGVLGIVIDQNMPPRHGRPALFFGKMVNTTFAPQILSLRSGLPIIPVFIRMVERGRYEITFYKPNFLVSATDEEILNSMNSLNMLLEQFIRENPSQWLWVHRRFKPLVQ